MQPHRSQYWEQPGIDDWEVFAEQTSEICSLLGQAEALSQQAIHVVSTDEKTGMQALERDGATLPAKPGKTEKREFNYIRHGTKVLIANYLPATGQLLAPSVLDSRKEEDFVAHIITTVATAAADKWVFLVDQLNIHMSASLLEWVAATTGDTQPLGQKGKCGILKNKKTRMEYLANSSNRLRFLYLPKHCSWLNPVEGWFSGLSRRVLKRGNFLSTEDLKDKILAYVCYYNERLVKKYNWKTFSKKDIQQMLKKIKESVSAIMT